MWTIFGGAVEDEDTRFEDAIHREIREELNLDFAVAHWVDYVCPVRSIPGELDVIVHVYTGMLDRPLDGLMLYEGQAMGWFDAEETAALAFGFAKKPIVLKFFAERIGQQGKEAL